MTRVTVEDNFLKNLSGRGTPFPRSHQRSHWSDDDRVKAPTGARPRLPPQFLASVLADARQFGRRVATDDLFLLALTEDPRDPPARRALRATGVVAP
jgi:hypothetical protein